MGDARSNMGNSLLIMGAIMGSDVRICSPRDLWPSQEVQDAPTSAPSSPAPRSCSPRTPTRPYPARCSCTPMCGCRWVSPRRSGTSGSSCSSRTRSTAQRWRRPASERQVHALPAGVPRHEHEGRPGRRRATGMTNGLEVTNDVFESDVEHRLRPGREPSAHDQGDHGRHDRRLTPTTKPRSVERAAASSCQRLDQRS
jgi:ornithine carbamoyltransferase